MEEQGVETGRRAGELRRLWGRRERRGRGRRKGEREVGWKGGGTDGRRRREGARVADGGRGAGEEP